MCGGIWNLDRLRCPDKRTTRKRGRDLAICRNQTPPTGRSNADEIDPCRRRARNCAAGVRADIRASRDFSFASCIAELAPAGDVPARVRYDVDVRRTSDRLLAAYLQLRARSALAGQSSSRLGPASQLLGVIRIVAWPGDDQSSLRPRVHREHIAVRFQLYRDRFRRQIDL